MKTILIVEDTEINIDLITQLLEDEYSLLFARDGEQGLKMALQNNYDSNDTNGDGIVVIKDRKSTRLNSSH